MASGCLQEVSRAGAIAQMVRQACRDDHFVSRCCLEVIERLCGEVSGALADLAGALRKAEREQGG